MLQENIIPLAKRSVPSFKWQSAPPGCWRWPQSSLAGASNTGLNEALAWCRQAQPAIVIISPKAFGGAVLPFRVFTREALSGTLRAKVLRLRETASIDDPSPHMTVSGFEEDAFANLTDAEVTEGEPTEHGRMIKEYLTQVL